jgi:DNA-binding CsgD family transcriptional regulator
MIPDVRRQKGQGRIAEEIAQTLNVSPSTIYQARKILKEASPEDIAAIENGEASFKAVSKKLSKKPDEEKQTSMRKPEVKIIVEWLTEELRLQTIWAEKRLDDEKEQGYLYGLNRALSCLTNKEYPILHCISQDMPENESALLVKPNVPKRQDKEGI